MNTPKHKLGQVMQRMVEQGKRPCFRLEGIRITRASNDSRNPGYLYLKNDNWDYLGKITPEGTLEVRSYLSITEKQVALVMAAIKDPESTAMSSGKETGTCCCCGRTLTNKLSIELGIGPICRGFWFPPEVNPVDTVAMLETLDAAQGIGMDQTTLQPDELKDTLELDLGFPRETTEEVKKAVANLASLPTPPTPVARLVLGYFDLMHEDQMKFLTAIEEGETNASN